MCISCKLLAHVFYFGILNIMLSHREMKPPASTKTAVYRWNQQITEISKDIGMSIYLVKIYKNQLYCQLRIYVSIQVVILIFGFRPT